MPLRTTLRAALPVIALISAATLPMFGQSVFGPQGGEYRIAGELVGDQVMADISQGPGGGYLVWQDNHTDGYGSGIKAVRITEAGTSPFEAFRVNSIAAENQENPRLARLAGGGHLIVWQGGPLSRQSIYGRVISPEGQFLNAADVRINTHAANGKLAPAVAALAGGGAAVVWSSIGQDDASNPNQLRSRLQGVYLQRVDASGALQGIETLVNQQVEFNQRTPAVAALKNGSLVVAWVSERLSGFGESEKIDHVAIYARLFNGATGAALTGEFPVNTSTNICANPSVVGTDDGGFTVVWSEKDVADAEGSWDISGRHFPTASAVSALPQFKVNSFTYGDQYRPTIRGSGTQQLVVWSSLGQDGSREGVFGRFLSLGQVSEDERQINTQANSRQVYPTVAALSDTSFTVIWSSFVGGAGSLDLVAQRYATALPKAAAPVVSALSSYELLVAWPQMAGFEVAGYHLYVDGQTEPLVVGDIFHKVGNLNPGTTHTIRMAYKLVDGRVSPLSDAVSATTWGADLNFDGLPDDWQRAYFGESEVNWGSALADTDGDGVNNRTEFLAGTNPKNNASVLRLAMGQTPQGWQVSWESVPGLVYRLQVSSDFQGWSDVGGYRFAPGTHDAAFVDAASGMAYYRVIRIR